MPESIPSVLPLLTRRELMAAAAAGLLAAALPARAGQRAAPGTIITLYMAGGASHIETFDPKILAPREVSSSLGAVSAGTPGLVIGAGLPLLAARMGHIALLRGVSHGEGDHRRAQRLLSLPSICNSSSRHLPVSEGDVSAERSFPALQKALCTEAEPWKVRAAYGPFSFGQNLLRARRLAERGARRITVTLPGWDTHVNQLPALQDSLLPMLDRGFSALLDDLKEREMLQTTLVVWISEFGRSPILNSREGRDHWPAAGVMALAGGGVRGGQALGATDKYGAYPVERAITAGEAVALRNGQVPQGRFFSSLYE